MLEDNYDFKTRVMLIEHTRYWESIVGDEYRGIINSIYPIKQKDVKKILDYVYNNYNENIGRIYVFGSSCTYRCTFESDLDIGIELVDYSYENALAVRKYMGNIGVWDMDLHIIHDGTDRRFYKEVALVGACIYNKYTDERVQKIKY